MFLILPFSFFFCCNVVYSLVSFFHGIKYIINRIILYFTIKIKKIKCCDCTCTPYTFLLFVSFISGVLADRSLSFWFACVKEHHDTVTRGVIALWVLIFYFRWSCFLFCWIVFLTFKFTGECIAICSCEFMTDESEHSELNTFVTFSRSDVLRHFVHLADL